MKALVYVVPIAIAIFALFDLARSEVRERAGIHRFAWVAVIVLLPVIGPLVWILISRLQQQQGGAARPPSQSRPFPTRPPSRTGPVAPDDDPEFLGKLGSHNSYDRLLEEWEEDLRRNGDGDAPTPPGDNDDPTDDGPDGDVPAR